MVEINTAVG